MKWRHKALLMAALLVIAIYVVDGLQSGISLVIVTSLVCVPLFVVTLYDRWEQSRGPTKRYDRKSEH